MQQFVRLFFENILSNSRECHLMLHAVRLPFFDFIVVAHNLTF